MTSQITTLTAALKEQEVETAGLKAELLAVRAQLAKAPTERIVDGTMMLTNRKCRMSKPDERGQGPPEEPSQTRSH